MKTSFGSGFVEFTVLLILGGRLPDDASAQGLDPVDSGTLVIFTSAYIARSDKG